MPISRNRAAMAIAPDTGLEGSPFTIPAKPGQPRAMPVEVTEPGDLFGFLIALGLVCGLIALFGFAVLPRY
jgi:hypothetical protein